MYMFNYFLDNIFSCIPDEKNANKSKILAKVRNTDLSLLF